MVYTVYEIECETSNHRYVGFSGNVHRRIEQHRDGTGAVFTRLHGVKSWRVIAEVATKEEAKELERKAYLDLHIAGYAIGTYGARGRQLHSSLPCGCRLCPEHLKARERKSI